MNQSAPHPDIEDALDLLRSATTPNGILASPTDVTNYRRIWARDSVMCGLAGLVAGDDTLIDGLRATLVALADAQGPEGQIPSNVLFEDGEITDVSYGGLCGRVDAIPWFVVGAAHYVEARQDDNLRRRLLAVMQKGLALMRAWTFNDRDLVYVPLGGDWADEYILHGYVLYDQLMRIWALRCYARAGRSPDHARTADAIAERLRASFWPGHNGRTAEASYHPYAYTRYVEEHGPPSYWLASLAPSGYATPFDAFGNALSILLDLPDAAQQGAIVETGETVRTERPSRLVPAFWPPITDNDPEWAALRANHRGRFNNQPGHYHNGGCWPMVNGWWGLALADAGHTDAAQTLLAHIQDANQAGAGDADRFPEYIEADSATPGGTAPLCWSAAAEILLDGGLDARTLSFGPDG